ncbi:MAG TPA: DUF58 domain-containing protein [Dehalococcoidia bacterium]|nr:DUF58 domain-containing protein [Dehalococcoidia bacterium]|tara:strand:- start:6187 stop:7440 length:1254 start_codon:yes stop_codon:yes gene_type:complete
MLRQVLTWPFMPQRRALTVLVVILVAAIFIATGTGFWLLYRIAYILAMGIPVALVIAWLNTRALNVNVDRRTLRGQVGQEAEELIEVRNRSLIPKLWVELEDPCDLPGHQSRRAVVIPSRGLRSWVVSTVLKRRGLYDWGPLLVRGGDPFGIFYSERRYGTPQQILVYPRVVDLPRFQTPPASLPGEGRFRRRTHYITPNASGIRDYAPGDPLSRIHWRSTAHTGELMVKTFELDPTSDIWVIADLEGSIQAGDGEESTEEYIITVAASVAQRYIAANRSVGLIAFGEDYTVVETERGQQQLSRILESLAVAKATGEAPLANLLMEEQRRFGRHTTLVVVTASTDDSWVSPVQSLVQRGVRAAVVLVDPSTFGGEGSPLLLYGELTASDILSYVVAQGDDLSFVLSSTGEGAEAWQN